MVCPSIDVVPMSQEQHQLHFDGGGHTTDVIERVLIGADVRDDASVMGGRTGVVADGRQRAF